MRPRKKGSLETQYSEFDFVLEHIVVENIVDTDSVSHLYEQELDELRPSRASDQNLTCSPLDQYKMPGLAMCLQERAGTTCVCCTSRLRFTKQQT